MGDLKKQLKADLVTAMKARDDAAKSNIRMALAAIGTAAVSGTPARERSGAEEQQVITREVHRRKDAAEAYAAGGRPDQAAKELAEADFLSKYLPTPLTHDEVKALVDEEIAAASAGGEKPGRKQMGQIIKAVSAKAQGRADGGTIAGLVKAALA